MKKTYPTSTKSQQWAKHLKPFGKRLANKSTRKIGKAIAVQDEDKKLAVKPAGTRKKKRCKFAIEYCKGINNSNGVWKIWKKYITAGRRDRSLEALIKKHGNSPFEFLRNYKYRAKDL